MSCVSCAVFQSVGPDSDALPHLEGRSGSQQEEMRDSREESAGERREAKAREAAT